MDSMTMDQLAQQSEQAGVTPDRYYAEHDEHDFTTAEVSRMTQQSEATIRRLAAIGQFPGVYKTGSRGKTSPLRFPASSVRAYRENSALRAA